MSQEDRVSNIPRLIDKDMTGDSISEMKNGKIAGTSGVVSKVLEAAGESEIKITTNRVSQIIVRVIPAEWELSTIVNCY